MRLVFLSNLSSSLSIIHFHISLVSIEKRVYPIPFRTRQSSSSSPMILHILVWESRPMPRFSFERSSYDGLSSLKSPYGQSPAACPHQMPAGLFCVCGLGREKKSGGQGVKWIDGLFICPLFCHSTWLGEFRLHKLHQNQKKAWSLSETRNGTGLWNE